jgi:hypothetical protein
MVVDVVDPHDHTRPDAVEKAKGLTAYARDHGHLLGHIDLVAKIDGRYRRLHLEKEQTRKSVDSLKSADALAALYSRA